MSACYVADQVLSPKSGINPVVLFVYARPDLLAQTLEGLRANNIPLLYVYCDGPADDEVRKATEDVRSIVRDVDWCEIVIKERSENFGLGRSILAGVSEVLAEHERVIVVEDDVVLAPGTYAYLCAALERYEADEKVFSIAAHLYDGLIPAAETGDPFFGGRFSCLGWATWRRAWVDMDFRAMELLHRCRRRGIDVYRYGADLPELAFLSGSTNTWAVRFALVHLLNGGLCLYPPRNYSKHIGYDARASNAKAEVFGCREPVPAVLPQADQWPISMEAMEVAYVWQSMCGGKPDIMVRALVAWKHLRTRIRYRVRCGRDHIQSLVRPVRQGRRGQ